MKFQSIRWKVFRSLRFLVTCCLKQLWRILKYRSVQSLRLILLRSGTDSSSSLLLLECAFEETCNWQQSCCLGSYRVCSSCEQVLPSEINGDAHPCGRCRWRPRNPASPTSKHLYKLLVISNPSTSSNVILDRVFILSIKLYALSRCMIPFTKGMYDGILLT